MKLEDMVIASVDDHLIEPPNMFEHHLPANVEQPRVVDIEGGAEIWVWGDTQVINIGLNAVVGRPKNEWAWSLRASPTCERPPTTSTLASMT
jgi:hypothetical protein